MREVVSFARRSARMNESQTRAWERHATDWVLDLPREQRSTTISRDATVDWAEVFGREAPLVVEIGSGAGDSLVPMAAARPEVDFVAFEVFQPMAASTLGRMAREGVDNIRVVIADGAKSLDRIFPEASLGELWTFFADPWHKTKHHKRRLVSTGFADTVASRLTDGGLWRLATDWEDYALWQREVLDAHPQFTNQHDGWAPRFTERPVTRFEQRGLDAGREIRDLTYVRKPR